MRKKLVSIAGLVALIFGIIGYKNLTKQEDLTETIIRHEGFRTSVYYDSLGNKTIGIGHYINGEYDSEIATLGIDPRLVYYGNQELTKNQVFMLFEKDLQDAREDAIRYLGEDRFNQIPKTAQNVLVNMAFNLGYSRLSKFTGLRNALNEQDYSKAAKEMRFTNANSPNTETSWYTQTGKRAKELVRIMEHCN